MAVFLFIGVFCIFFFVPVQFRIYYRKLAEDDHLVYEMSFLGGLLKRKKEVSLIKPTVHGVKKKEVNSGNWFFYKKSQVKKVNSPYSGNSSGLLEFLKRFEHSGLGLTLLSYFLPAKYHHWLLVVEKLEKRGQIHRFLWKTRLGTGDAAETSFLYGLAWSLKSGIVAFLTSRFRFVQKPIIEVIGDYQGVSLDTVFDCIFRAKLGYIIIVAFIARFRHRLLKGGVGYE